MAVELKGKIKVIGEFQTFDSGFTKQQIVITEPGQYPNDIPIDFLKDKTDLLQNYKEGDDVIVSVNIRGSEYNGKYYVGLNAWTIKKDPDSNSTSAPSQEYKVDNPTYNSPKEFPQANQPNSFVDNLEPEDFDPPF